MSIEHLSIDVLKKCEDLIYSEYEPKSNEKPLSIKIPKNHISVQTLPSASSVEPDKIYSAIYHRHRLHSSIHARSTMHKRMESNLENEYSFRK